MIENKSYPVCICIYMYIYDIHTYIASKTILLFNYHIQRLQI